MKLKLTGLALMAAFLLTASLPCHALSSGGIGWYAYKKGMALSEKRSKKIFLYFGAEWCAYCTKMTNETFKDAAVVAYLNQNFIPIKVDFDRESETAASYDVKGLPASWFLTESGDKISNLPGFIPPQRLLNVLKYIHSDSYKEMTFPNFKKKISSK